MDYIFKRHSTGSILNARNILNMVFNCKKPAKAIASEGLLGGVGSTAKTSAVILAQS